MRFAAFAGLLAATLAPLPLDARQQRYINGLFVSAGGAPIELIAYAEGAPGPRLSMSQGTLEDVPTITPHSNLRVLCNVPLWKPASLFVTSGAIFKEDNAETRTLSFASRMLNVYALELRASDLERPDAVARLLRSVKASQANPGYLVITLVSEGLRRYYPVRLTVERPYQEIR